ncbi:hypothetical protein L7F22_004191 [Adiantum nelumboides]|nr:hypothetical protein [Adiantum nelumboides]
MYAKCGLLLDSQEVFDKLPCHDVIGWTALMAGYAEHGFKEEALVCFEEMQLEGVAPDIMLWNTAILSYAEEGEIEEALVLYRRMQEQCVPPNSFSSLSVLRGCCKTAAIEVGRRIHVQIEATKSLVGTEELLPTALIDMYGKCGSMVEALQVFNEMPTQSIVQWNTIITSYARHVECKFVFSVFNEMRKKDVQPDALTFSSILFACSHGGFMREGQMYYESMVNDYGMTPQVRHDSCLVDLLGRVGCLGEAVLMLEIVPSQEDSMAWNTVLGASQKSGDVELSEQAFHTIIDLGKQDDKSFIMMANIYADIGV